MKLLLLLTSLFIFTKNSLAQDTTVLFGFVPGYYIINSNAQYAVAMYGSMDYQYDVETECLTPVDTVIMKAGEVVVAFEYSNGRYYCFDPNGRMLVFQGYKCLTRAPIVKGSGVGKLIETIELIDGGKLIDGAYYWIVGQDVSKSTITIQIEDGNKLEIPQSKIKLYSNQIKEYTKILPFGNVAD